MSNVKFLRGTQAKLDSLTSFQEGAFYLTSDTDRLYFAQSNSELAHLNQYVINVKTLNDLTGVNSPIEKREGDFYYVEQENILCTYRNGGWIQINKVEDHNDIAYVDSVSFASEIDKDTGNIKISYTINQNVDDKDGSPYQNHKRKQLFSDSFEITKEMIGQIQIASSVDIKASTVKENEHDVVYVKPTGVGASTDAKAGFVVAGGDGIEVSTNEYGIVLEGQTYSLGSEANEKAKIQLNDKFDTPIYEVEIAASNKNDNIIIDGSQEGKIIVEHKDGFLNEFTSIQNNNLNRENSEMTVITGFELNNGHITEVKTENVQLIADKIKSIALDNNNKLVITVTDAKGSEDNEYNVSTDKRFGYTIGTTFVPIDSDLNDKYYTIDQIDAKLQGLNALTFKGGIAPISGGTELILPLSEVQVGDVYIVTENGVTSDNINAKIGDLFIATGNEKDGYITEDLSWTHVPAGDETIYTYELYVNGVDNSIVLKDNANSANSIKLLGDDAISVVANDNKIQYSHAVIGSNGPNTSVSSSNINTEVLAGGTITAITQVSANKFGHVTECQTTTFEIPGDDTLKVDSNNILLKNFKNDTVGEVKIEGGALLTASSSENKITIDHDEVNVTTTNSEKSFSFKDATNETDKRILVNVVDSITSDGYGHISNIKTSEIELIPINQFIKTLSKTESNNKTNINIVDTVNDSYGEEVSVNTTTICSESINMSLNDNTITAEIVWGTF